MLISRKDFVLFWFGLMLTIFAFTGLLLYLNDRPPLNPENTLIPTESPKKGDLSVIEGIEIAINTPISDVPGVKAMILSLATEAGLSPRIMLGIARCESGYEQFKDGEVKRGVVNNKDVGVFQINEKYWLEASKLIGYDIYTEEGNVKMAIWIATHYGYKPWSWSKSCWSSPAE